MILDMENASTATKRTYTRLDFSVEQEEQLIDYVKGNPALYNPKDVQYKNKNYRDRLWTEFGSTINKSGKKCRCAHNPFIFIIRFTN